MNNCTLVGQDDKKMSPLKDNDRKYIINTLSELKHASQFQMGSLSSPRATLEHLLSIVSVDVKPDIEKIIVLLPAV